VATDLAGSAPLTDGAGEASLRFEGIVKWFGGVQSLAGVSLTLEPGKVLALVGDNGAGKSTLVKILSGVHQPDGGQIWLDGEPLTHLTPPQARALGIETVHQDLALCDNLNAIANVVLGQEPVRFRLGPIAVMNKRQAVQMARDRLQEVGIRIADFNVSVRRLSGGQRQAIAIARAMMHASKLMILDEPTAALGVHQTQQTLQVVRSVAARGPAVMVISHSMEDVFAVADRIVVLRLGRIVLDTPTSETSPDVVVGHITGGIMERFR
jgi:ABC-type sugar transport system ATPase subunit